MFSDGLYTGPIMGFDTETTGVKPRSEETQIVTAALIYSPAHLSFGFEEEFMMNCHADIPQEASDVHGITNEMKVVDGIDYVRGLSWISSRLKWAVQNNVPITAYNASFDLTLIEDELQKYEVEYSFLRSENAIYIDPLVLDKGFYKYRKGSRTLSTVAFHYGFDLREAHNASADVEATIYLARRLMGLAYDKLQLSPRNFVDMQQELYAEQTKSLQKYLRKKKDDEGNFLHPELELNGQWPIKDWDGE